MKTKLFILTSILVFALALTPNTSEAQRRRGHHYGYGHRRPVVNVNIGRPQYQGRMMQRHPRRPFLWRKMARRNHCHRPRVHVRF